MRTRALVLAIGSLLGLSAPASARLVYERGTEIVSAADDGGAARPIARGTFPAVSPDGRLVKFGRLRGTRLDLRVVPARGGPSRLLARRLGPGVWAPDSRRIVCVYPYATLWTVTLTGRATVLGRAESDAALVSFSPDGDSIAFQEDSIGLTSVAVLDVATGARRTIGPGREPVWGPPGIAYVTDNGTRNEPGTRFDVHLAEAGADRIVASSDESVRPVAWSGDGHRLLLARGDGHHVALLDVPTGAVTRVPGTYRDVADLSSDGTSILAVDSARRVVAVSAWGRQRILARRGRFPSWSR